MASSLNKHTSIHFMGYDRHTKYEEVTSDTPVISNFCDYFIWSCMESQLQLSFTGNYAGGLMFHTKSTVTLVIGLFQYLGYIGWH